ncbi:MAG: DUF5668 domain-containing protein [Candidatus Caldatribacteriota bacterium]|jgi:membrane-bound ClpP family serine protease|nr:DUF5668 domain-containing protein [Atribacterota bacterium]MDD3030858.1 DUF5668 domain-containing protein [Atribacterota bacterium]MDD3640318.1 DUF5668 domain-containing protein [Atribacterota bacterium]MDD4288173.1 DUF5668 domain-containing protein [Atribacterota bacterium]MDD4764901.1 DUF5668 domain-containing protein [Atribacterota bacterium]
MGDTRRNSGQWLFGLIILIIGIIFLLENLFGIEVWENVWLFWPIVFLFWGLVEMFQKKSIFFGVILIAIGLVFLAKNFELYQLPESVWKYWPVIIIAIGIDQIFRKNYTGTPTMGNTKAKKGRKDVITTDDEII